MQKNTPGGRLDRRCFITLAAGGLAGAALTAPAAAFARVPGANDRLRIGVIGCGNRAASLMSDMFGFMSEENFEFTALCDVWKVNLEKTAAIVKEKTGLAPRRFVRHQDLLAAPGVDAVMVTTPDHGHCPILRAAVEAGKDAFCEKPLARTLEELLTAADAVKRSGRIVQVGTQRRSDGMYMAGAEFLRGGGLGQVSVIDLKWNDAGPRWERQFEEVRREEVDWEGYLLGQSDREWDPRRFRCWHLYRDYSVGVVGLLGAHHTDLVHWCMEDPFPESVTATGGILVWKNREHYDTLEACFKYPKGFLVNYETRFGNSSMRAEAVFYGTGGVLDTTGWSATSEGGVPPGRLEPGNRMYPASAFVMHEGEQQRLIAKLAPDQRGIDHMRNWVRCIRDRRLPNATIEHGFSHALAAIMAHRAADTGRRVTYDPATRSIKET